MLRLQKILIDFTLGETRDSYESLYGDLDPQTLSVAQFVGRVALENIANCDALYHNLEHTIMVNSVGNAILKGKQLQEGGLAPGDWLHFNVATFCHDIGFVPGICQLDDGRVFDTGAGNAIVEVRRDASDAQLGKWHVDRGKQFVRERFGKSGLVAIDCDLVCDFIEMTRFPSPPSTPGSDSQLGRFVRAADLIGQLGDPRYLQKIPALYYEFMETGSLADMGYENPDQMRRAYADFYHASILPHVEEALGYLRVTEEGRQWASSLHAHVYDLSHGIGRGSR